MHSGLLFHWYLNSNSEIEVTKAVRLQFLKKNSVCAMGGGVWTPQTPPLRTPLWPIHMQNIQVRGCDISRPLLMSSFSLNTIDSCRPLWISTTMRPLYRFIYNHSHEAIQTHHNRIELLYLCAGHNHNNLSLSLSLPLSLCSTLRRPLGL